jgi:hypothetical protein
MDTTAQMFGVEGKTVDDPEQAIVEQLLPLLAARDIVLPSHANKFTFLPLLLKALQGQGDATATDDKRGLEMSTLSADEQAIFARAGKDAAAASAGRYGQRHAPSTASDVAARARAKKDAESLSGSYRMGGTTYRH